MSVLRPNPFLERMDTGSAARSAMRAAGWRMAYVRPNGQEIQPDRNGNLVINGSVSTEKRVTLDWKSVLKFTRPEKP